MRLLKVPDLAVGAGGPACPNCITRAEKRWIVPGMNGCDKGLSSWQDRKEKCFNRCRERDNFLYAGQRKRKHIMAGELAAAKFKSQEMKVQNILVMALVFLGLIGVSGGQGVDKAAVDFEVTADYFGKYILRGQNLYDDPVFHPSISGSYKGLTAAVWGNVELTNINGNSGDFSELDYSLDYSGVLPGIEGVEYSVGIIYYDFPGSRTKDTTEVYWALNLALPLSPSLTVYHDVDEAEGTYVSLAAAHSIEEIAELGSDIPVGIEIGASLGWGSGSYNKYYWGTDQSKLNDLAFSVSLPTEIGGWTLVPSANYVTLVSDDIRDTDAYGTDSDFFFVGVSLSTSF